MAETVKVVRQLRQLAADTIKELRSGLGPELSDLDLRSLHPSTLVQSMLAEDPAAAVDQADAAVRPPAGGSSPQGSSPEVSSTLRAADSLLPGGLPPVDVEAT